MIFCVGGLDVVAVADQMHIDSDCTTLIGVQGSVIELCDIELAEAHRCF